MAEKERIEAEKKEAIAKEENSAELLVSQITSYQDPKYLIPGYGSTRQSRSVYHAARQVATLYNLASLLADGRLDRANIPPDFKGEFAYIIMTKNKGKMGKVGYRWIPSKVRFEDSSLPDGILFDWDTNN